MGFEMLYTTIIFITFRTTIIAHLFAYNTFLFTTTHGKYFVLSLIFLLWGWWLWDIGGLGLGELEWVNLLDQWFGFHIVSIINIKVY
jgi:hypothetical protein